MYLYIFAIYNTNNNNNQLLVLTISSHHHTTKLKILMMSWAGQKGSKLRSYEGYDQYIIVLVVRLKNVVETWLNKTKIILTK